MAFKRIMMTALASVILLLSHSTFGESAEERDARMEWWREARFGLFIHWGIYAIPAGEWEGKPTVKGGAEWIQSKDKIPAAEYAQLIDQFNPIQYDADDWVQLAKQAGMQYIVITSKHHDGFCLWDSAQTEWDVASTPYKKDLLKPLAEACRKYGIKLCFYHSIMDWKHPDYGVKKDWRGNADNPTPDMDVYTTYMKAQLKELLSEYGDIGVLWFDGEWEDAWTHERGIDLDDYLRGIDPSLIINNRVDKGRQGMKGMNKDGSFRGDFGTPEQEIPHTGFPGVDWESCMTMNKSWGYKVSDQNWKSTEKLIRNLVDIASKGGNYLLNVGPTAEGLIPAPSVERLQAMGAWMKPNGESIYGTVASPLPELSWGRCTVKNEAHSTVFYLHVFQWPENEKVTVPGLKINPTGAEASLLATGKSLKWTPAEDHLQIEVGPLAPDPIDSVIKLTVKGPFEIKGTH
ncbi:alpha-L-fucosidase [Pontiellaceae bacterium B1224]|nr:alpha-L-fucosidase [Pontiellaceae bacterium B1224]